MAVLKSNPYIECVIPIILQRNAPFYGRTMVRVFIRQTENTYSPVDAAIRKNQLVAANIVKCNRFLNQWGINAYGSACGVL